MNDAVPIRLYQTPEGGIWMVKQDDGGNWVPYQQIKMFIEGDDLIVKQETREIVVS